jgi:hypothetical protein
MKRMGRPPVVKALNKEKGCFSVMTASNGSEIRLEHVTKPSTHSNSSCSCVESCPDIAIAGQRSDVKITFPGAIERAWRTRDAVATRMIPKSPCDVKFLSPENADIANFIASPDGFFEVHRHFMIGGSFLPSFHRAILLLLDHSPTLILDAYSMAVKMLQRCRSWPNRTPDVGDAGLDKAAHYVGMLGRLTAAAMDHMHCAAVTSMLGQLILVHNSMMRAPNANIICQGTLLAIKPWLPALVEESDMDAISLTLISLNTILCLLHRGIPVFRMPETERLIVDRYLGLTAPLLPMLYDLCVCSHDSKAIALHDDLDNDREDPYTDVERRIYAWEPRVPYNLHAVYEASEAHIMLAQCRLYRLTALLIIHRLRYPLGTEDERAVILADSILDEMRALPSRSVEGTTGFGLDFPLLVAMVERPERAEQIHRTYDPYRFRLTMFSEETRQFARDVRAAYDSGFRGLWLDLVPEWLHGAFLP